MMARTGTKRKISESSQSSKDGSANSVASNKNPRSSDNKNEISEREQMASGTETTENSSTTNSVKGPNNTDPEEIGEDEFTVESIRGMKNENGKRYFHVKWFGYDEKDNSWEPEENMQGSQKLISEYISGLKQFKSQKGQAAKKKQNSIEIVAKKPLESVGTVDLTDVLQSSTNKAPSTVVSRTIVVAKRKPQVQVLGSLGQNIQLLSYQNNAKSVQQTDNKQNTRPSQPRRRNNITVIPSIPLLMQPRNQPTSAVKQQDGNFSEPQMLSLIYNFLLWVDNDFQLLQFNLETSQDQLHKLVITEDIKGLSPLILYGSIQAENKNMYCFVQFEEHDYIDCVTPVNLCRRLPGIEDFIKNQIAIARNIS